MCALTLIGLGIYGSDGMTGKGYTIAVNSDILYIDTYTNVVTSEQISSIEKYLNKKLISAGREFLEDGEQILSEATDKNISLLVSGDPIIATTHTDLLIRANGKKIVTQVIHNSSILSSIPGETGLHAYKFGRIVTSTKESGSKLVTVYHAVYDNLVLGLHTIILMEYNSSRSDNLSVNQTLNNFLSSENDYGYNVFSENTLLIILSRIGLNDQAIITGPINRLLDLNYGNSPHTIILPGKLHFSEIDSLSILSDKLHGEIKDNTSNVKRISTSMVTKYTSRTLEALVKARNLKGSDPKFKVLFENIEAYISDSERFLNEGRSELAVLSIGYAEGLLDSLRFTGELEIEW